MRQFIITNPNLTVGKPGDIVTSDQLRMTDAKLDEWVSAGYGVEIGEPVDFDDETVIVEDVWFDELAGLSTDVDAAAGLEGDEGGDPGFNPHTHTVDQVRIYIDNHPDEADTIRDLEAGGKNRSSIIKYKAT